MSVIEHLPALRMDRSRQAAPQVFDALRELIVSLDLPPGTVLPRADLGAHYGVSLTPVRDALLRLGEEGLVDIFPQHATVVSRIDIPSALRAHFMRRALEGEIVRDLAAGVHGPTQAMAARLREHITRQSRALASQDFGEFTLADRAFHQTLYDAAGMGDLWLLVRQRSGHIDRLRRLHLPSRGKAQAVVRDHKAIVDAIEAGEPDAAQDSLRKHLAGTMAFVDEVRRSHPEQVSG